MLFDYVNCPSIPLKRTEITHGKQTTTIWLIMAQTRWSCFQSGVNSFTLSKPLIQKLRWRTFQQTVCRFISVFFQTVLSSLRYWKHTITLLSSLSNPLKRRNCLGSSGTAHRLQGRALRAQLSVTVNEPLVSPVCSLIRCCGSRHAACLCLILLYTVTQRQQSLQSGSTTQTPRRWRFRCLMPGKKRKKRDCTSYPTQWSKWVSVQCVHLRLWLVCVQGGPRLLFPAEWETWKQWDFYAVDISTQTHQAVSTLSWEKNSHRKTKKARSQQLTAFVEIP